MAAMEAQETATSAPRELAVPEGGCGDGNQTQAASVDQHGQEAQEAATSAPRELAVPEGGCGDGDDTHAASADQHGQEAQEVATSAPRELAAPGDDGGNGNETQAASVDQHGQEAQEVATSAPRELAAPEDDGGNGNETQAASVDQHGQEVEPHDDADCDRYPAEEWADISSEAGPRKFDSTSDCPSFRRRAVSRGSISVRSISARSVESFYTAAGDDEQWEEVEQWEDVDEIPPDFDADSSAERFLTAKFRPGRIGITIDYRTRRVQHVADDGQAQLAGVVAGMRIQAINGRPPTCDLLDAHIAGGEEYVVTFSETDSPLDEGSYYSSSSPSQAPRSHQQDANEKSRLFSLQSLDPARCCLRAASFMDALIRAAMRADGTAAGDAAAGPTLRAMAMANSSFRAAISDPQLFTVLQFAAGGAAFLGGAGGAIGTAGGCAVGATIGILPAFFTFGLSIPIGAAMGGAAGCTTGFAVGGTTGLAGGAVAGASVAYRVELQEKSMQLFERIMKCLNVRDRERRLEWFKMLSPRWPGLGARAS